MSGRVLTLHRRTHQQVITEVLDDLEVVAPGTAALLLRQVQQHGAAGEVARDRLARVCAALVEARGYEVIGEDG